MIHLLFFLFFIADLLIQIDSTKGYFDCGEEGLLDVNVKNLSFDERNCNLAITGQVVSYTGVNLDHFKLHTAKKSLKGGEGKEIIIWESCLK